MRLVQKRPSNRMVSFVLIGIVVVLAGVPLILNRPSDFKGADDKARQALSETNATPWFQSLWSPSPEVQSFLFAVQAAIGAGFVGYYLGLKRGQRRK